jgi:hypothetical protein
MMRKTWPWIVGLLAVVAYFGYFEAMALVHPDQYDTLSHAVATVGAKWPLAIWLCGVFTGVLGSHFFWPWAANPMGKGGG